MSQKTFCDACDEEMPKPGEERGWPNGYIKTHGGRTITVKPSLGYPIGDDAIDLCVHCILKAMHEAKLPAALKSS